MPRAQLVSRVLLYNIIRTYVRVYYFEGGAAELQYAKNTY